MCGGKLGVEVGKGRVGVQGWAKGAWGTNGVRVTVWIGRANDIATSIE